MRTAQVQQQQQITAEQIRQETRSQKEAEEIFFQVYKDIDTDIDKFWDEVEETAKEEAQASKIQWRLDNCGVIQKYADPQSGKFRMRRILCNLCDSCKKYQASYFAGRIAEGCKIYNSVRVMKVEESEAAEIWKRVGGKDKIYKIPQQVTTEDNDGNKIVSNYYFIAVPSYLSRKGSKVTFNNLSDIVSDDDWLEIVNNIPKGRRTSGSLGKSKDDSKDANSVSIQVNSVSFKNTDEVNDIYPVDVWKIAMLKTSDLNPKTPEEVIVANNKRVAKFVSVMKKYGYELKHTTKINVKVDPDNIDWKISNLDKVLYMNSFRRSRKKTADS